MAKNGLLIQAAYDLMIRQTGVFRNRKSIPLLVTMWALAVGTQSFAGRDDLLREAILYKRDSYQILHPENLSVAANGALAEHATTLAQIEEINAHYLPNGTPGVRISDRSFLILDEIFVYVGTREELLQTRTWRAVNGMPGFFDFIELGYPTFPHGEIAWPNRGQDRVVEWREANLSESLFPFICSSFFRAEIAELTNRNMLRTVFFIEEEEGIANCYERLILDLFGLRKLALDPVIDRSVATDLMSKIRMTPDRTIFEN